MNRQGFFSFLLVLFSSTVLSGGQCIDKLSDDTFQKLKPPQLIEDTEKLSWLENEPTTFKNPTKKKR